MAIESANLNSDERMVTGGELVVRALEKKGVKYIFTLSGGHIAPIYQHLMDSDIKLVDTRHEQAAVFMADAYARLTGEVGVALVTAGPGFTNALTGVANARMAGSPVLLISGRIGLRMEERLDLQEIAQREVIDPIVKWSKLVTKPARIPEFIDLAMKTAISSSPGPTFIDLPVDVQGETVPLSTVKFLDSPFPMRAGGDPKSIAEAAKIIEKSERPIVIAGSGAVFSNADKSVLDFVEASGIPIFTLSMGRGIVLEDHPLSFGPAVIIRPGAAGSAITRTDCVIFLGTRINLYTMYGALFPPNAKIIHVNIDPVEIGRNRDVSVGIMGDVGIVSDQLKEALAGKVKADRFSPWVEELKKEEEFSIDSVKGDITSDKVPIHPQRLMKEIDEFLGSEGIVTADGGDTQTWIGMMRKSYGARRYLESGMFGCLGVGIPFAVTAKLLNPKEKVVCATGDGSLGFNFMEINTAMRFNLPIVIVVSNDLGWGMIRHSQSLKFGPGKNIATELGDIDYHKMVEAMGGYAERVTKPEEIKPALKRAFDSGKVSLINVMTDPDIISPGSYALATIAASGY
ncbi:MAG: thiamine pyrophosphate-binding protein [Deltaproteobacteria bacterium]|uniref:Thiamine pyrophosphate-binding protein n=1 Tax=Candidatus Zymogenus saltonus TaxID=2844893 RepID=A0A9D8KH97_9DELT|nr:thiamine pyrophosphate-binding protein [Candidatus Zymogenus saltonus]